MMRKRRASVKTKTSYRVQKQEQFVKCLDDFFFPDIFTPVVCQTICGKLFTIHYQ